jgi:hypothetical protein
MGRDERLKRGGRAQQHGDEEQGEGVVKHRLYPCFRIQRGAGFRRSASSRRVSPLRAN